MPGLRSPTSRIRAAIHLHQKYIEPREPFWPNPIWWVVSVPAPGSRATNNTGPRTVWRARFGNTISAFTYCFVWPEIRAAVETHSGGLIIDRDGAPVAALPNEEFATKDSELLACDVECRLAGIEGFYLELDVPGLDEFVRLAN